MEHQFCPYCMSPAEDGKPCGACGLTQGSYIPSPHHLPPGTVLKDRYLVGRVLGEGGFGITYIGCDLQLELKTAIKEYFPTDKASRISEVSLDVTSYTGTAGIDYEKGLKKFLQEARTMARMDKQPVIVNIRDFFEANHTAYIVMEYLEGTTFKELVEQRGGRIPAGELFPLIEPLFSALEEMHSNGLIHRDISPENLMIEKGAVRLLDFGCARESSDGGSTLTIVLKHAYAPVEQYQSKGQGPWTDVYALSATIYYCLTGRKPPQAMDRLVEDELIRPRKLGVDLTAQQEEALLRGMRVPPKRRFQSMEEFHTALYESVVPDTVEEPISAPGLEDTNTGADPDADVPDRAEKPAAAAQAPEELGHKPFRPAAWLRQNRLFAAGIAAALALVILAAVLPKAPGPGQTEGPAPSQTVTGTPRVEESAPPAGMPSADPDVDCEALFMETVEWLRLDHIEAEEAEVRAKLDALPIEELFAGAVSVTTLEELDAALDRQDQPIIINADLTIPSGEGRGSRVPVLINEGVTLTLAWDSYAYENVTEGGSDWAVDGSILVNRGTVRGGSINMGDWDNDGTADTSVLLNYGTLYSDLGAGYDRNNDNVAVNLGAMGIAAAQYRRTSFYNLGTLLHGAIAPEGETVMIRTPQGGDYFIDFIGGFFYNSGEIVLEGQGNDKRGRLDVAYGSRFANHGAIRLGNYGELNNHSTVYNHGQITATGSKASVRNMGWLWNIGPDCAFDAACCHNVGLVQAGPETAVDLSAVRDGGGGAVLSFGWYSGWDEPADVRLVSNAEEFYAALEDRHCTLIGLGNGTDLTLTEDLILTKGLAIPDAASLTVDGASLTVAGEDGCLLCDAPVDLRGGVFTVRDGALALVGELKDCGGLTVKNQGYLMSRVPLAPNDGAVIELSEARYLCSIGGLELKNADVNIERGVLRGTGGVELYGCAVDVGEQGEFLTDGCGLYFDPDTVITNYGILDTNGWDTQEFACRLTNYGQLGTSHQMLLSGTLVNHGYFRVWTGPESRIKVSGSLENRGTVELLHGGAFQPWAAGTVTGVPGEYVAN